MSWTKREFIVAAFEDIGISSYQFDLQPEMLDIARRRLDAMMEEWNANGIRLSYPTASTSQSGSLDDDTNVPDMANSAIISNLALRIAPAFGKQISIDIKISAFKSYTAMLAKNVKVPEVQLARTIPAGQGNKLRRTYSPFLLPPENRVDDTDGPINLS